MIYSSIGAFGERPQASGTPTAQILSLSILRLHFLRYNMKQHIKKKKKKIMVSFQSHISWLYPTINGQKTVHVQSKLYN